MVAVAAEQAALEPGWTVGEACGQDEVLPHP